MKNIIKKLKSATGLHIEPVTSRLTGDFSWSINYQNYFGCENVFEALYYAANKDEEVEKALTEKVMFKIGCIQAAELMEEAKQLS